MADRKDLFIEGIHYRLPSYQTYKTLKNLEREILKLNLPFISPIEEHHSLTQSKQPNSKAKHITTINDKVQNTLLRFQNKKIQQLDGHMTCIKTTNDVNASKLGHMLTTSQYVNGEKIDFIEPGVNCGCRLLPDCYDNNISGRFGNESEDHYKEKIEKDEKKGME